MMDIYLAAISITFTDTEVNNCFSIPHKLNKKWTKNYFSFDNIPTNGGKF